jgi:isoaspartyl peptidase/L-asparaginase-like protein (Ntn-hydrolase superfamily)
VRAGGDGGLIVVDRRGRIGVARTTRTMSFAAMGSGFAEPVSGT